MSGIINMKGIIELSSEMTDKMFLEFWQTYCKVYSQMFPRDEATDSIKVEFDDKLGVTVADDPDDDDGGDDDGNGDDENGDDNDKPKTHRKSNPKEPDWLQLIKHLNEVEEVKGEQIDEWRKKVDDMMTYIKVDGEFMAMVNNTNFEREDVEKDFYKLLRRYKVKAHDEEVSKWITENKEVLFGYFINEQNKVAAEIAMPHINNLDYIEENNIQKASGVFKFYNRIYLVFFKPYKQEFYLIDAQGKGDINAMKQNQESLAKLSKEAKEKLKAITPYRGNKTLVS